MKNNHHSKYIYIYILYEYIIRQYTESPNDLYFEGFDLQKEGPPLKIEVS